MTLSLEYRIPLFTKIFKHHRLRLSLFSDYGFAENKTGDTQVPRDISSVGAGLMYSWKCIQMNVMAAKSLRTVKHDQYNIQDDGVHANFKYEIF